MVIATRHNQHAKQVLQALDAGKHVFVEKPLALTHEELADIQAAYENNNALLMVGFNRRFAPMIQKTKSLLASAKGPKAFVMTVNAGFIPKEHWTQNSQQGGGRLVGEGCHFIDLLRFLAGSPIASADVVAMEDAAACRDTFSINLSFEDGSIGTVHYFANGSKRLPKERLAVYAGGKVIEMNNYRRLDAYGFGKLKPMKSWRMDKGQNAEVAAFIQAIEQGGHSPIPFEELMEVSKVSIDLAQQIQV